MGCWGSGQGECDFFDLLLRLHLRCVICYAIVFGREKGVIAAFVAGLLMDFLTGVFFGRHLIIYLLSGVLASTLADNTFGKNFVTASIINFVVSLIGAVVMALYLYVTKIDRDLIHSVFVVAPVYALYNMVVGVFIYIFVENLMTVSYWKE